MRWNRITFGDITVLSKTTFNLYKTVLCVLALAAALLLAGCGGAKSTRAKADVVINSGKNDIAFDLFVSKISQILRGMKQEGLS